MFKVQGSGQVQESWIWLGLSFAGGMGGGAGGGGRRGGQNLEQIEAGIASIL